MPVFFLMNFNDVAAYRAKLGMLNTVSKIRGQVKTTGYPQTEGLLGDCMLRYGRELGEESNFGESVSAVRPRLFVFKLRREFNEFWIWFYTLWKSGDS